MIFLTPMPSTLVVDSANPLLAGVVSNEAESGSVFSLAAAPTGVISIAASTAERLLFIQAGAGLAIVNSVDSSGLRTWDSETTPASTAMPAPQHLSSYFAIIPANIAVAIHNTSNTSTVAIRRFVLANTVYEMQVDPRTRGGLWRRERRTDMLDGRTFLDRVGISRMWLELHLRNHPIDEDAERLRDIAELRAVLVFPSGGYVGLGSDYSSPDILRLCRAVDFEGFYGWKSTHNLGATGKIRFEEVSPPESLDFLQDAAGEPLNLPSGDRLGLPRGI